MITILAIIWWIALSFFIMRPISWYDWENYMYCREHDFRWNFRTLLAIDAIVFLVWLGVYSAINS